MYLYFLSFLVNTLFPAQGEEGIILMGHSLGGAIAINVAASQQVV